MMNDKGYPTRLPDLHCNHAVAWVTNHKQACGPAVAGEGAVFVQALSNGRRLPRPGEMLDEVRIEGSDGGLILKNSRILETVQLGEVIVVKLASQHLQHVDNNGLSRTVLENRPVAGTYTASPAAAQQGFFATPGFGAPASAQPALAAGVLLQGNIAKMAGPITLSASAAGHAKTGQQPSYCVKCPTWDPNQTIGTCYAAIAAPGHRTHNFWCRIFPTGNCCTLTNHRCCRG